MAMDPKRRMQLEAKLLDIRSRFNPALSLVALQNAPTAQYEYVKVFLDGEDVRLACINDSTKMSHSITMDAVVACTMAIDILEKAKDLFPGDFDIRAQTAPPTQHQS